MSKPKKFALILIVAFGLIMVGVAIVIPMLINVDRYRPQVAAQIQEETGKPTQIGHSALTVFPAVAIRVDHFSLGNPAGFPAGDFVKVNKILAVVNASALMHHQVEITSLELDDLTLGMLEDTHGKWNFENQPAQAVPAPAPSGKGGTSFTLGIISRLTVRRGNFSAASLLASGVPGPPLMKVGGASIDLRDVNLNGFTAASGRSPGETQSALDYVSGWITTTVFAAGPEVPAVAHGAIRADALQFGPLVVSQLKSQIRLYPKQVFFDNLELKCYSGKAAGNLSLNLGGPSLAYAVDANVKDVNVAEFLNTFPQTRGQMTGTLEGAAKMAGAIVNSSDPLAGVTGAGQGSVRNGRMPSLQITGNLSSLAKLASVGPANGDPSSFSSLSCDFQIADGRLSSKKINLTGSGVDVNGAGSLTMAGDGSLDYTGDASIAANGRNPLGSLVAGLAGARIADGKMTIPFSVGGTFVKPKFSLKGRGEQGGVARATSEPANVVQGLSGILEEKAAIQVVVAEAMTSGSLGN